MVNPERLSHRRLDQIDRRSQVGVSGAMRARDVSRPDDELLAEEDDAADRKLRKGTAPTSKNRQPRS